MVDERELIEHRIEIDEYASAILRIPKVLTAIDLKSLMNKANKLFNLAEIPLVPHKRKYSSVSLGDAEKKDLVNKYDKSDDKEKQKMADSLGISLKALYQKVWSIRKDLGIAKRIHIGSNKKYSDELVAKISTLLKTKTVGEVAKDVGMNRKVMYDLVLSRTGKTPKEFKE